MTKTEEIKDQIIVNLTMEIQELKNKLKSEKASSEMYRDWWQDELRKNEKLLNIEAETETLKNLT